MKTQAFSAGHSLRIITHDKLTKQNTHSSSADGAYSVKFCPYSAVVIQIIAALQIPADSAVGVSQVTQYDQTDVSDHYISHYCITRDKPTRIH